MPTLDLVTRFVGIDAGAGREFDRMAGKLSTGSSKWKEYGAAGVAVVGTLIAGSVELADKFEEAHTRLEGAVKNVGVNFDTVGGRVESLDSRMAKLGYTSTDVESSMSGLVSATKSPTTAIHLMGLAADIARGRNISLAQASQTLVKVETGHVSLLGRLGIATKDATGHTITEEQAVKRLSDLYGGDASRYAKTFGGEVASLKAQAEDLGVKVGTAVIPVIVDLVRDLEAAGHVVADVAHWFEQNKAAADALAVVLGGALLPKILELKKVQQVGAMFTAAKVAMIGMATKTGEAGASFTGLLSNLNPVKLGLEAVAAAGLYLWHRQHVAYQQGQQDADNFIRTLDTSHTSLAATTQATTALHAHLATLFANAHDPSPDKFFGDVSTILKAEGASAAAAKTIRANEASLADQYGMSQTKVEALAKANHIDLAGSYTDVSQAIQNSLTPTQQLTHDNTVLKKAVVGSADAVTALTNKLDALIGGPLAEHAAAQQWTQDLEAMATAAKGNTGHISDNTKAGLANARMLQTQGSDLLSSAETWVKNGRSQQYVRIRVLAMEKAMRAQAIATTGNKTAVDRYLRSLNLTPGQISKVLGSLGKLKGGMDSAKGAASKDGTQTTDNYVAGLISSAKHWLSTVESWGAKLGAALDQGAKGPKGIHSGSPSKKAIQAGKWYAQGLAIGVGQNSNVVYLSGAKVAQLLADGLVHGFSGERTKVEDTFSQGLQSAMDRMNSKLQAGLDRQRQIVQSSRQKLAADIKARNQAISSLAGSMRGGVDFGSLFGTDPVTGSPTLANGNQMLGRQAALLHREAGLLKKLHAKHLRQGLIEEIAGLPPDQAVQVAQEYVSGDWSIAQANRDWRSIQRSSRAGASTVEDPVFRHQIHVDQAHYRKQEHLLTEIRDNLHRFLQHPGTKGGDVHLHLALKELGLTDHQVRELMKRMRKVKRESGGRVSV